MTKELVTVPVGTSLEEAEKLFHKHKVEKILIVDENYHLKGLITYKDILKRIQYPLASKDKIRSTESRRSRRGRSRGDGQS
jgi:CBS-domain-containing membrane protein